MKYVQGINISIKNRKREMMGYEEISTRI